MKPFLIDCLKFFFFLLFCFSLYGFYKSYQYNNNFASKGIGFKIPNNEQFETILAGNSGANMEAALGTEGFSNMSLNTLGGGIRIQQTYLEYFSNKKNQTKSILFFADPSLLSTEQYDKPKMWRNEKPELAFIKLVMKNFDINILLNYLFESIKATRPDNIYFLQKEPSEDVVTQIDSSKLKRRINSIHTHLGNKDLIRNSQKERIANFIKFINGSFPGCQLAVILNPNLLGDNVPNKKEIVSFMTELEKKHAFQFFDYSNVYNDPSTYKYFYNIDHLNAQGQIHFVDNYLKPILQ